MLTTSKSYIKLTPVCMQCIAYSSGSPDVMEVETLAFLVAGLPAGDQEH